MRAYLLYRQKEWGGGERYSDEQCIVRDLGLNTLFQAAAKEIEKEDGKVRLIQEADPFLAETMRNVMLTPLETAEEILYRQEILKNCLEDEDLIERLYRETAGILAGWEKLGRRANAKAGDRTSVRSLITEIHVLQLFVDGLHRLREILGAHELRAEGLLSLRARLEEEFPGELEESLRRLLRNLAFYANEKEHGGNVSEKRVNKARIVLGCGLGEGLKPDGFVLEEVDTEVKKRRDPNGTLVRMQDYWSSLTADFVSVQKDMALLRDADYMEQQVAAFLLSACVPFRMAFNAFFDQLHFQTAFYRGAVNLKHYMERFDLPFCFPRVSSRDRLGFRELKELVMAVEQRICPVGNDCLVEGKRLMIVTGANQGGKSTFLRSIGIAQIMLQCGLMVAAWEYESGIYPSFFTHFTRREDCAMNSGRLDEELSRMSRIADGIAGKREKPALVLLNESFATTTEREGSSIAYDIIRALTEAGVRVLTVTHLLSFARKMYREAEENGGAGVEFLSAERLQNGRRTFRMVQHEPELSSFGLDLYEEILGGPRG